MKLPFKLEVLISWWQLGRSRRSFERDPEGHQARLWRDFQAEVLTRSPLYRNRVPAALDTFGRRGRWEAGTLEWLSGLERLLNLK